MDGLMGGEGVRLLTKSYRTPQPSEKVKTSKKGQRLRFRDNAAHMTHNHAYFLRGKSD